MVIQNFDSKGNLVHQTICTEGASGKVAGKAGPVAGAELGGAAGTSCSSKAKSSTSGGSQSSSQPVQLLIYSPFFYGAP
jgi:hypothetical protein